MRCLYGKNRSIELHRQNIFDLRKATNRESFQICFGHTLPQKMFPHITQLQILVISPEPGGPFVEPTPSLNEELEKRRQAAAGAKDMFLGGKFRQVPAASESFEAESFFRRSWYLVCRGCISVYFHCI